MDRRTLLIRAGASALLPMLGASHAASAARARGPARRIRPTDPAWPSPEAWQRLNQQTGGQLIKLHSPLEDCIADLNDPDCLEFLRYAKNPFYLGDTPALTQNLGWVDAWTSQPSVYAVAARSTADIVAAVNFARENNLRLVVKGGGHSYLGTSCAPDSLLVWTRPMNAISMHDAFVAKGCRSAPQPAVTLQAGAIWIGAYDEVTVKNGRYVQGGGCTTVGVAGLVQSGGFGSFSKRYGTAAAGLIEAEVVTADGKVRIANACTNPDLFWGLKGGGGGSFGVVTRLTLKTRELPQAFGTVNAIIKAKSDAAYRRLISIAMTFYADALLNPHWGEQFVFRRNNTFEIRMVHQDVTQREAQETWRPFFARIGQSPEDFALETEPRIVGFPARLLWDAKFLKRFPGVAIADDRPGAPEINVAWTGDSLQAAQFVQGLQSCWLPAALLRGEARARLCDAMYAATRHWGFELHFNKGLAGAGAAEIAAARGTAMNPAVLDAFALMICSAMGPPAYPGTPGHEPDLPLGRRNAAAVEAAMSEVRKLVPAPGAYVSESNFFESGWQRAYWGSNYPKLLKVKDAYDPAGLFFVHHGVGSERWSTDGFTRRV